MFGVPAGKIQISYNTKLMLVLNNQKARFLEDPTGSRTNWFESLRERMFPPATEVNQQM